MSYDWLAERRDAIIQNEMSDASALKSLNENRKKSAEAKKKHNALLRRYSNAHLLSELFKEPIINVFIETKLCDLRYFETDSRLTPDIFANNTDHYIIAEVKINKDREESAIRQITDYSEMLSKLGALHKCAVFCGNVARIINTKYSLYSEPIIRKY